MFCKSVPFYLKKTILGKAVGIIEEIYYTEHQNMYNWSSCTWWITVNSYFWRNLITPWTFFNMILDVTNFVSTGIHLLVITTGSTRPIVGGMWDKKCLVKKVHGFQNLSVCWCHCQWKRGIFHRGHFSRPQKIPCL